MADGFFPELVSATSDPNAVANPLFVELTDGTSAVTVSSGSLNVLVTNGAGASAVNIQDGGNSITVDGTVAVSSVSGNVTVVQPTGTNLHVVVDSGSISATQGTSPWNDNLTQVGGSAVSLGQKTMANSIPVVIASDQSAITVSAGIGAQTGAVCDYNTAASVAGGASSNHDYTVVTNMKLSSVSFSCSGGGKVELKVGPVATLVSKWVGFVEPESGTVTMTFNPPIVVPVTSTGTVRLTRTNRQNQSQDLYSTIIGVDA